VNAGSSADVNPDAEYGLFPFDGLLAAFALIKITITNTILSRMCANTNSKTPVLPRYCPPAMVRLFIFTTG